MFGREFGARDWSGKLSDFMRIVFSELLKNGYDLYIPLQRPLFDELVILDRGRFLRCIIKEASLCPKRGPTLNTKFMLEHKETLLTDLSIDSVLAVLPSKHQVWLIPITSIGDITTIRLQSRSDWLLGEIYNRQLDSSTRLQRKSERAIVKEAHTERDFYSRVLLGSKERAE